MFLYVMHWKANGKQANGLPIAPRWCHRSWKC